MQAARLPEIEVALQSAVGRSLGLIHLHTHFNWMDGRWRALVEVTGPRLVTQEDVEQVRSALPEETRKEVEVLLWRRSNFVATEDGYTTYDRLTDPLIGQRRKRLYELFHTGVAGPKSTSAGAPKIEPPDP